MLEKAEPRNRDEREIAGYRYVLDLIHESHDDIPITPGVILQLHRDLYRYSGDSHAGTWKDSDNVIVERTAQGELVALCSHARRHDARRCRGHLQRIPRADRCPNVRPPAGVPCVRVRLCEHPPVQRRQRAHEQAAHAAAHVSIWLRRGKYVSIEKEIERTKETYYEALAASSRGWRGRKSDYAPFVTYMLGIIDACYRELADRFSLVGAPSGNEEAVRAFFDRLIGSATKWEIDGRQPGDEPAHVGAHPLKAAAGRHDREDRRRTINRISAVLRRSNAVGVTQREAATRPTAPTYPYARSISTPPERIARSTARCCGQRSQDAQCRTH